MEYRDYYATLGVARDASPADIKKAFRKLARANHPDLNKGDAAAEARFKEINEAHEVLSDPQKRKAYDQLGANWEQVQHAGRGGADPFAGFAGFGGAGGPGVRFEYRGNAEDVAGFSDFFQTFFGAAARRVPAPATDPAPGAPGGPRVPRPPAASTSPTSWPASAWTRRRPPARRVSNGSPRSNGSTWRRASMSPWRRRTTARPAWSRSATGASR